MMDNSRPDARPAREVRNGNDAAPQNRGSAAPPPFRNQVDDRGQVPPQDNGKIKGAQPDMARNQMGAQEAVGQLIWNQPPRPNPPPENVSIERIPRKDRVHPRHPAPLFQAEYSYSTSNSPPYIRDEGTPPDASPTHHQPRKVNRKREPDPPAVMIPSSKFKFGFSTSTILIVIQCILIFLFGIFVSYGDDASSLSKKTLQKVGKGDLEGLRNLKYHNEDHVRLQKFYPMFQDVHVMIFIGFGFLMTFLRKYGYSAVGYNMLIAAIAIQWSILCRGIFNYKDGTIQISIQNLINGDFAAGAVLISFGALLGVTNPLHLVTMCLIEVFLYALNEHIGVELFGAIDIGGSLFIHAFGAYFGLALSLTMRRMKDIDTKNEKSSYNSDVFAMIGTVFLWLFWPSFNGALAVGDDQHRAVLNTVLSLSGSCIFSFAASSLMCPENKFNMVHIQNASLAGGVAVGAIADLMIQPFGALAIGSTAGLLSTAGYVYLTPFLQKKLGLHDTCGVHNLHGMPGVMAGFISVIMAAIATEDMYGVGLYMQYPARAPVAGSDALKEAIDQLSTVVPGEGRTAQDQALYQLAALFTTIGIAVVGGGVTGLMFRIPFFGKVPNETLFHDSEHWEIPEDEEMDAELGSENKSYGGLGSTNLQMEVGQQRKVD